MNKQKWGRFLGIAAGGPQLPDVQLIAPLDYLGRYPPLGSILGAGEVGSSYLFCKIDPPLGGFAAGDLLLQLPSLHSGQVVTAVETADLARHFAPGVYQISGMFALTANNTGLYLEFANATPQDGWAIAGNVNEKPMVGFVGVSTTQLTTYFDFTAYFPGRWWAGLKAFTALTDTQIGYFTVQIQPLMLMDDGPSAR